MIRVVVDVPDLDMAALTCGQAQYVLDQLEGEIGARVVVDALGKQYAAAADEVAPEQPAPPVEDPGAVEQSFPAGRPAAQPVAEPSNW